MQDVVIKVLLGGGIGAVALMLVLLQRAQFEVFCGFVRRLSMLERTCLAGFLVVFVAYGGTKPVDPEPPDEGPYREVIDGVEWTYMVRDGYAVLGGDDMIHPAVASTTKELNIPSIVGGYPVRRIGSGAFSGLAVTNAVTIPDGVVEIGTNAFCSCGSLKDVAFPAGLRTIEPRAFYNCLLSSVRLPSSIRDIGEEAFSGCTELKQVVFCGSSIQIGASAFYGCNQLTDVFANSLEDWFGLSFAGPTSNPLYYAGVLHLGNVEIRSVLTIPESVTAIPAHAFCGLRGVNLVEFGGSIARIGQSAFSDTPEIASYSFAGATPPQFDYNCFGTSASGRHAYVRPGSSGWEALESRYGMEVVETESVPPTYAIAYCHLEGAENANVGSYTVTNGVEFSDLENRPGQAFLGWLPSRIDAGTVGDLCVTALWARVSLEANPVMPWNGVVQITCTVSNDLPATSQVALRCVVGGVTNELSHLSGSIGSANGTYCLQWNMQQDGVSIADGVELLATVEGEATYGRRYSRMASQSYAWKTVDTPAYSGRTVWQSGNIGSANSSSTMKISLQGPMTFDFAQRTSCEKTYDKLICYMDEVQLFEAMSGDSGAWAEKSVAVPRGTHTLRWTYTKDSQDNKYSDCAYVALPGEMVTQGFAVTSAVARLIRACAVAFYKTLTHWQAGEVMEERSVGEGGTLGTLPSASMVGYTFDGWWTVDENYDGEIVNAYKSRVDAGTAVTEDMAICGKWIANAYCITFDANGGEGTMADEPMTYDAEKALTACAFTRKGYTFAGWAHEAATGMSPPQLADAEVVSNLTAEADGVVTLYAKWTPNSYTVDFNPGRGGTGTMPDQPMTYDEEEALYANLFARTGYTFLGWTDDEGELEDVLFCDGVVVSNLTDEVDGEFDLYAVWAANEYAVRFNANGGEGTMSDQEFLYDEEQALRANAFTRAGYAFAGWAREAATGMSPPQLADADVVSNLTAEADGVVTLYAVWTANPYTIRFNANGGEGSMTDIGCVYGAERSLTVNAFTRKGYAFAGWATSEKGPVAYADGASVTSLTAEANGVVTLYAVWQAGANAVSFDGNGGTPSEASRSVLADAQIGALPSATRTGWTLVGWFTAASGGTQVSADTVITAAITFFAQWTANVYTVKFDANGGEGTMADLPMTYDAEKALTACAFTRKGYTFAGWAASAGGVVKYANGATVKNIAASGTVTLYAKWTPNNYVIDFNPGQGGTGTMSDQPMTYDEEMALYANLFARTGYTFLGWTDDEGELEEVLFYDGVVVSNLTDEVDGEYDLYAVWAANEYTVRFNANGGEGTMAEMGFLYDEAQSLPMNAFVRTGYAFAGWAREAATGMSPPQLADAEIVSNLTAEANGVVTLYAVWQAGANAVSFDGNGGTPSEASRSVLADAQIGALPSATRTGWTLVGWFTAASGGTQVSADTVITAAITFFAQWTANVYTVKFDANGGEGTMADEPMTYDAEKALTACAFTRKGYTFAGWAREAATGMSPPQLADAEVVSNLTAEADGVVTLYAKWTPNAYVIDFNPGRGGTGTMPDQPMTYDEEEALYANLFARTGYTFLGWTDDEGELEDVLFCDGVVVSNLTDEVDGEFDLYAVWAANEYTVRFNANGGEGTMAEMGFLYDEAQSLPMNAFVRTGYAFAGWAREAATGMSPPQLADADVVSNLTAEADGVVTLYAVWDNTGLLDEEETHVDVEKGEVAPYEDAAAVYDGYLYDGETVVGSVQVKVGKGKIDKSGVFSAKVTATVQLADEAKKLSFKGGNADERGNVSEMTDKNENKLAVTVGVNGLGGEFRRPRSDTPYRIDGARNVFSGKSDADKDAAGEAAKRYQGVYNVAFDGGTLSVSVDKKGKAKIAGTVEGNKVSATSQLVVGKDAAVVPVVIVKKVNVAFCLWVMADGKVEVRGFEGAIADRPSTLEAGAKFGVDGAAGVRALPGLYGAYLPNGIDVEASGTKWVVAGGAKAGKVAFVKGGNTIDESKLGVNPSGLKLTYKQKDGTFKGSFKAYNLESNGKIKAYTANVTGVMIGAKGYGTATVKKPACTFPISIE